MLFEEEKSFVNWDKTNIFEKTSNYKAKKQESLTVTD
jgi:hypothetical protein